MPVMNSKNCGTETNASANLGTTGAAPIKRRTPMWKALKWILIVLIFIPVATCGYLIGTVLYKAERVEIGHE